MSKLDDERLLHRMHNFFGYGRYESDYWFIGMEEGGGNHIDEVQQRLNRWVDLGATELLDNYAFHHNLYGYKTKRGKVTRINYAEYFTGKIKLQRTWRVLIRILLNIQDPTITYSRDALRHFQSSSWGRLDSDNCILEIFPLPSPSVKHWHYNEWSSLPFLKTRDLYKAHLREPRVNALCERISKHSPKVVLFFSLNKAYVQMWSKVAGQAFSQQDQVTVYGKYHAYFAQTGKTLFVVTGHPNYVRNDAYWNQIGQLIRHRLNESAD